MSKRNKSKTLKKPECLTDICLYEGLIKSFRNAESLIDEADLLVSKQYYSRAYTLYQLGIEELGKCKLLSHYILEYYLGRPVTEKELDIMGLRDHTIKAKIIYYQFLKLAELFKEYEAEKVGLFEEITIAFKNASELNIKKNQSLYVGLIHNKFISPSEIISKSDCDKIFFIANNLCCSIEILFIKPLDDLKLLAEGIKIGEVKFGKKIFE